MKNARSTEVKPSVLGAFPSGLIVMANNPIMQPPALALLALLVCTMREVTS